MFEELRELAETVRAHAPVVVEELRAAGHSLARIADALETCRSCGGVRATCFCTTRDNIAGDRAREQGRRRA